MGGTTSSQHVKRSSTIGCFPTAKTIPSEAYGAPVRRTSSIRESKKGKPGQIEGAPRICELTLNSLTLSWTYPSDRGHSPIYTHKIEYCTNKNKSWSELTSTCQSTYYTVKNVNPLLTYSFRVRAVNLYGAGKPSPSSHPVCLQHALKHNSSYCLGSRTGSLDAMTRYSIRDLLVNHEALPEAGNFQRQWRSMSLRNNSSIRVNGPTESRLRHTVRERPRLRDSVYDSPSDVSSDKSREYSVSPEPSVSRVSSDYSDVVTRRSADDILSDKKSSSHYALESPYKTSLDHSFMRHHPIKTSHRSVYRQSRGEIDMGVLNEIANLDLALRQSYNTQSPVSMMKNSHTSPDIYSHPQSPTNIISSNGNLPTKYTNKSHDSYEQEGVSPSFEQDFTHSPNLHSTNGKLPQDHHNSRDQNRFFPSQTTPEFVHSGKVHSSETLKFDDFHDEPFTYDQNTNKLSNHDLFTESSNDLCISAQDLVDQIWNEAAKLQSNPKPRSGEVTPRIISNTLTCDWESLSDTSMDRTLDWRNGSEDSLTKHLEVESEIDSCYEFE